MSITPRDKFRKITDFTKKLTTPKLTTREANPTPKCPISPIDPSDSTERGKSAKQARTQSPISNMETTTQETTIQDTNNKDTDSLENATLQAALGPLVKEFQLLRESVDTVHTDYKDLKQTISRQKEEIKQELTDKIEKNRIHLDKISSENLSLRKENNQLKTRLDALEQQQLSNNIILTCIPEGPFEPYATTKQRIYEMLATTISSGNAEEDLNISKKIEITNCKRVGKYRVNYSRPISVTFAKKDDKESLLQNKRLLPDGIFANEELPLHIKQNRDKLRPIL